MAETNDVKSVAIFCDFENLALGAKEANFARFDIQKVLKRLLVTQRIVVKRAYCNWSRFEADKSAMHQAGFELIDIPPTGAAGKNSADIRLVVDAMDLCYTKDHVDIFVIVSGDSDFQPLVNKLKENRKWVVGVGISKSTSSLLVKSCDEFIYYDDLVRADEQRKTAPAQAAKAPKAKKKSAASEATTAARSIADDRLDEAFERLTTTLDALVEERGEDTRIYASALKNILKRRHPGFDERYYGFPTFSDLLKAAQDDGLLTFERDEKSGNSIVHPRKVP